MFRSTTAGTTIDAAIAAGSASRARRPWQVGLLSVLTALLLLVTSYGAIYLDSTSRTPTPAWAAGCSWPCSWPST